MIRLLMLSFTLQQLRFISLIEGVSYLLLLFVGMPLKYGFGIVSVNKVFGLGHGLLTIIFCMVLFFLWKEKKITNRLTMFVFIASLIPFGAFVAELKLKKLV